MTDLADSIAAIAAEAGRYAMDRWQDDFARWEKAPGNPVCEIDMALDAMLRERLMALVPDAGWLSEESVDDRARLAHDRVWVVDPIDGTRDYLRGRPGWAVSIALVEYGQPVVGVLDAPARGELWSAVAGGGACRNGETLRTGTRALLPGARVPADSLPRVDADLTPVFKPNSIALRIGMVAAGEADLVATLRWGAEWDIAAAVLLAREAGAAVTDAFGERLEFNTPSGEAFGVLATAPGIHAQAVERLSERAKAGVVR
ncbi:3'(2'),5'-bisphosphate nucleotidase CysQ [Sphingomonas canadensis]|uniref:3'(2'),5'-bisphosphate nucleotidase CysQ n=1 Tax=Sphingomonas canadensis TaxID=1219257 RepID=A0ABW3H552_9SPHN|nr:3'(2'),5'-bisphosphate nucleotidase CysQ [Sphingomonas canadensis]MCW3836603.1 3'(2'),5'-bisphosphate nucleotidase CysQ [Sphingomonas canadensis]